MYSAFSEIGTINIEEMVLENYGQDYEELDVDVDGMVILITYLIHPFNFKVFFLGLNRMKRL